MGVSSRIVAAVNTRSKDHIAGGGDCCGAHEVKGGWEFVNAHTHALVLRTRRREQSEKEWGRSARPSFHPAFLVPLPTSNFNTTSGVSETKRWSQAQIPL